MADEPDKVVEINDFNGLMLSVDPRDLPEGGAVIQTNCCSLTPGELRVRGGMVPVTFET